MRAYRSGYIRDHYGTSYREGTVYVYEAGGTTAASVYTASSGGSAVNSVSTNRQGFYEYWVDTDDYSANQQFKEIHSSELMVSQTYDYLNIFGYGSLTYAATGGTVVAGFTDVSLSTAITAAGASETSLYLSPGAWALADDVTVPANVGLIVPHGAVLTIATGKTLTINGPFEAGMYQVFSCTGTGAVAGLRQSRPEWFGVNTTPGTTDTYAMFKDSLASLSSGGTLKVRKDTYSMTVPDATKLIVPSNVTLDFEPGTVISKETDGTDTDWWRLSSVSNVTIIAYGVEFKYTTKPTSDEARHIFFFSGTTNVSIFGAKASNAGGDGFYFRNNTNMLARDIWAYNCRRNGISITSATGFRGYNFRSTDNTGTSPQVGLDIEPNATTDDLTDVVIDGLYTEGNASYGLVISLTDLDATSNPIDITINNHSDVGSYGGLYAAYATGVLGDVNINNPRYYFSDLQGISIQGWCVDGPRLNIRNPYIQDANQNENASIGNAIYMFANPADSYTSKLGNVHLYYPHTTWTTTRKHLRDIYIYDIRTVEVGIDNVTIIDPYMTYDALRRIYFGGAILSNIRVEDGFEQLTLAPNAATASAPTTWKSKYDSSAFTAARLITLSANWPIGTEITFAAEEPTSTHELRVVQTDANILPLSAVVGKYIYSKTLGSTITIKKFSATSWRVINQIGTWTAEP